MAKKQPNSGVPVGYMILKDDKKKGPKVPIDRGPSDLNIKIIKKKLPAWDIPKQNP